MFSKGSYGVIAFAGQDHQGHAGQEESANRGSGKATGVAGPSKAPSRMGLGAAGPSRVSSSRGSLDPIHKTSTSGPDLPRITATVGR